MSFVWMLVIILILTPIIALLLFGYSIKEIFSDTNPCCCHEDGVGFTYNSKCSDENKGKYFYTNRCDATSCRTMYDNWGIRINTEFDPPAVAVVKTPPPTETATTV